jgi:serine O-acetyltransferase
VSAAFVCGGKQDVFSKLAGDLERKRTHYVRIDNFVNRYLKITFQLGTLAVVAYRMMAAIERCSSPTSRNILRIVAWPANALLSAFTGVHINSRTSIGRGLVIHNFSAIMVDAVGIGENLTLNQGVSIGESWRGGGKPTIGNNVFLGSGSKVLGNISIGNDVVVAANSFVDQSVPDDCTVVGVPARIISRGGGSNYLRFTAGGPGTQKGG